MAVTKKFLAEGFQVNVVARDFSGFKLKDKKIKVLEYDLTNFKDIPGLVKKIGQVDCLVNNAGMMNSLPFTDYSQEKMEKIIALNIQTPVALIREVSKYMLKKGKGRIVNVASIAGHIGHPDIWYGVTKAGMINITKSFAKLLGPKGLVINAVAPGPINTQMLATIPSVRVAELKKGSFLNRIAKPEEVAEAIYWLGTNSPEYINGICLDINNGAKIN